MNFLAHVYLANSDPDSIVGQLCGDFVRGSDLSHFPEAIERSIRVHRAVDSYTDKHPLNLRARELFSKPHRRYAGIVTDVAYDHYLALDWESYSDVPLQGYSDLVDRSLEARYSILPVALQRFVPYLKSEKILQNNVHKNHIDLTLQRISQRRKSLAPLATAASVLWENSDQLKAIFDEFFPQLVSHSTQLQEQYKKMRWQRPEPASAQVRTND